MTKLHTIIVVAGLTMFGSTAHAQDSLYLECTFTSGETYGSYPLSLDFKIDKDRKLVSYWIGNGWVQKCNTVENLVRTTCDVNAETFSMVSSSRGLIDKKRFTNHRYYQISRETGAIVYRDEPGDGPSKTDFGSCIVDETPPQPQSKQPNKF